MSGCHVKSIKSESLGVESWASVCLESSLGDISVQPRLRTTALFFQPWKTKAMSYRFDLPAPVSTPHPPLRHALMQESASYSPPTPTPAPPIQSVTSSWVLNCWSNKKHVSKCNNMVKRASSGQTAQAEILAPDFLGRGWGVVPWCSRCCISQLTDLSLPHLEVRVNV